MSARREADDEQRVTYPCGLCGSAVQFGPHRYAGRKIVEWDTLICEVCENSNWDGLDPGHHRDLMQRLQATGIRLQVLPGGFIRIPPRGH
jgi:hypothetical protein